MKTTQKQRSRLSESSALSGKPLNIRSIGSKEAKRFDSLLGDYHYLGESRPVGDSMRMVAEIDGEWVGLLMWGSEASSIMKPGCLTPWPGPARKKVKGIIASSELPSD